MVLFIEDEQRMKEMERREKLAKRTRLGVWLRRLFKTGMVLVVLFAIGLGILAALGGNHEALKKGLEDYLTQLTGLQAEVGVFNDMSFFPDLRLDAEDITFRREEAGTPQMTIAGLNFTAGFFDMMFKRKRFKVLRLEELRAEPGIIGEKRLFIRDATLSAGTAETKPGFIMSGQYGEQEISAWLEMAVDEGDKGRPPVFYFPPQSGFNLDLAEFRARGHLGETTWGGLKIKLDALHLNGKSLSGDISLRRLFEKADLKMDLLFGQSRLLTDLTVNRKYLRGAIVFPVLHPGDLEILSSLHQFWQNLISIKPDTARAIDLYEWDADFQIEVQELYGGDDLIGNLLVPVQVKEQELSVGPVTGTLTGGVITGNVHLDARTLPATLTAKGALKDWNYALLQKALRGSAYVSGGTANVKIALNSQGKTYNDLWRNLDGEAALVGGRGEFGTKALNVWGAGLVNAMLPSVNADDLTVMNCLIADFKIEDGIARADPLFMDTARLILRGEGEINFPENAISLKLEPKAKDPALLDIATAVNVTGPILDPAISTDSFSLFEKLGGLALGMVNPAFLVFSLTDLGLTADHPCHDFLKIDNNGAK